MTDFSLDLSGAGKWSKGILGDDGYINCIPYNSNKVLKINPTNNSATLVDFGLTLTDTCKWSDAVKASNGMIYALPYSATDILKINVSAGTATRIGSLTGNYKWNYCFESNAYMYGLGLASDDYLRVNLATDAIERLTSVSELNTTLPWYVESGETVKPLCLLK